MGRPPSNGGPAFRFNSVEVILKTLFLRSLVSNLSQARMATVYCLSLSSASILSYERDLLF